MPPNGIQNGESSSENNQASSNEAFEPSDRTNQPPQINLPDELWITVLESPCAFSSDIFAGVMLNLIKNPNITSSHLFRADIFYDSEKDNSIDHANGSGSSLIDHLKTDFWPRGFEIPGCARTRTITCHFYSRVTKDGEENIVVYLPHVTDPSELPFYHPSAARLAFIHANPTTSSTSPPESTSPTPTISLSYCPFPSTPQMTPKLHRIALRLLQTVHKHGTGQLHGYQKRVHLDQTIPQDRYQNTYTRLKTKYGRWLSENWAEVTDPGKHVFEDIAIAAFLTELWGQMYGGEGGRGQFPGFVDIGCGNGVLTYILLAEGHRGWGFDARERKTWSIFPPEIRERLQRRLLVPSILQDSSPTTQRDAGDNDDDDLRHDGLFDTGTFIISNHADELTAWTPLLAHLNDSAFVAIPCCSHDLAGARFRAPQTTKSKSAGNVAPARLPQQQEAASTGTRGCGSGGGATQAAETGSFARTPAQKKMPSAYATLCSYVASLAADVGFEAEKDVLRIPSTRNHCIIGRKRRRRHHEGGEGEAERREEVVGIVERELGRSIQVVGGEWIARAEKLARKPGSGH